MNRRTFGRLTGLAAAAALVACAREPQGPTIADVVGSTPELSTLSAALAAADLSGALAQEGPYTLFAPRNSAFEALPPSVLDDLLLPENQAELARILQAHVVAGSFPSSALAGTITEVTSLDGTTFIVDGTDGVTVTGGAGGSVTVVQPDIEARNGVIHVIDGVLLP